MLIGHKQKKGEIFMLLWLDKQHEKKWNTHFHRSEGMTLKYVLDSVLSVFSFSRAGGMPRYDTNRKNLTHN